MQSVAASRAYHTIFGLSNGDSNQDYTDIDFAIHLQGQVDGWPGDLKIFEGGVEKRNFGPIYSAGDIFRVAVEQGVVKYYRNGALLYTSTQAPTYPLIMDTALFHVGAQIKDAVLYAGVGPGGSLSMPAYTAYYSFGGKLVGMRRANYSAGNGQFRIVGDHLGSTTLVVDTSTPPNVVQRQYSKPYGESAWQYTSQSTGGRSQTKLNYTGQKLDTSGLLDYNARVYDPGVGRFPSADSIVPGASSGLSVDYHESGGVVGAGGGGPGNAQALGRYSYVMNNPVGRIDPSGHESSPKDETNPQAPKSSDSPGICDDACREKIIAALSYDATNMNMLQSWLSNQWLGSGVGVQEFHLHEACFLTTHAGYFQGTRSIWGQGVQFCFGEDVGLQSLEVYLDKCTPSGLFGWGCDWGIYRTLVAPYTCEHQGEGE